MTSTSLDRARPEGPGEVPILTLPFGGRLPVPDAQRLALKLAFHDSVLDYFVDIVDLRTISAEFLAVIEPTLVLLVRRSTDRRRSWFVNSLT
jgi:hypothetical protein